VRDGVNKYSYLKTTHVYHNLPNYELTGDFSVMSFVWVRMLPPIGKIHHGNIILLDSDSNPDLSIAVQAC
jgi:hypothetical protein